MHDRRIHLHHAARCFNHPGHLLHHHEVFRDPNHVADRAADPMPQLRIKQTPALAVCGWPGFSKEFRRI
nr:MAG TPA: hypothetical protein [Caudoviricetes sp.]